MRDLLRAAALTALGWHLTRRALARRRRARLHELITTGPTMADALLAYEAPLRDRIEQYQETYGNALRQLTDAAATHQHEVAWGDPQARSATIHHGPTTHVEWSPDHEGEPLEPVDLTPYIAHPMWEPIRHLVVSPAPPVGEHELEHIPEGCWRTVSAHDGRYIPCNQPPAGDLGLCTTHRDELAEVPS